MDTAMSVKRSFVSERSASNSKPVVRRTETQMAVYAVIAGILLLIAGAQAAVDALMIIGFFLAVSGGLAMNAMFWANYYEKHGQPKIDLASRMYE